MRISRNSPCPCGSGKKHKRCCGVDVQPCADPFQGSLSEQLAAAIQANDVTTIEEANVIAQKVSATHNSRPTQEFLGISPEQMAGFLYKSLESPELVTFNEDWSPKNAMALQIFYQLADGIGETGVKATGNGNLPLQLCRDILANTPEDLFALPPRIRTEIEFEELHVLRVIGEMTGLIKQYKTKFVLTPLGQELIQAKNQSRLFNCLFKAYASQFNWGYRDGYPEIEIIQTGWLFSLYCLSLFGNKWRSSNFYAGKFVNAFPMALNMIDERLYTSAKEQLHSCYKLRTLERFAHFFGVIEIRKQKAPNFRGFELEVRAPHLPEWLQFHV